MIVAQPDEQAAVTPVSDRLSEIDGGFATFRSAVSDSFVPLRVDANGHRDFRGRIRAARIDRFQLAEIRATPHAVLRTPELIARRNPAFYKLSIVLSGSSLLIQDGREALLEAGDFALYDTRQPYSLVFDHDIHMLVVMFPQQQTGIPSKVLNQLAAVRISGLNGIARVVLPYLTELGTQLDLIDSPAGAQLAHTAVDLISAMFTTELDIVRSAADPRVALLNQVHSYIETHLALPELDPTMIAGAHFISTRHLHNLFQAQGSTVAGWIRSQRLENCRQDLLSPFHVGTPVSAIAARWGLTDAAHFSRIFKSEFGVSPTELRSGITDRLVRQRPTDPSAAI